MSNKNPDSIQTFVDYVQQEKNSIYNGAISEDKVKEIAEKHLEREGTLSGLRIQQKSLDFQRRVFENNMARMRNTFMEIENNLDQMIESSPMRDTFHQNKVKQLKSDLETQYQQPYKGPRENVSLRSDVSSQNITDFSNIRSTASFLTDRDAIIAEQSQYLSHDGIYDPPVPWQESLNVDILDNARDIVAGIEKFPKSYKDWDTFMMVGLPEAVQNKAKELADSFFDPESENTFTSYSGKEKVKINGNYYDRNTITSFLYNELIDNTFNVLYRNNDGFSDYLSYKETGKTLEERYLEEYNKIRAELVQMRDAAGARAYNSVDNAAKYGFTNINTQAANRDAAESRYDDLIDQLDNWKEQTLASGLKSGFSLPNFLSFGVYGLLNDVNKIRVLNKLNNGETLSGEEAEIARLIELEQTINSMGKEMYGELRTWASIGQGVGTTLEMAPQFLVTMGATSGIGAGVKYGTKTMAKKFIRNKTWNNATKLARTFALDAAKFSGVAYARGFAGAPLMPSTFRGYTNEYVSQFEFDGNGNFKFKPKNQAAMIAGSWIDGANEIASEFYGGVFDDVISLGSRAFGRATGISKILNKSEIGTWMRRAAQTPMSAATKKMLRNAGYTGVFSEPLSEVFGDFMSQTMRMMIGADYRFDHFKNADYWLTTMGVSTLYGGALTTISSGTNILREAKNARQLLRAKKEFLEEIKNEELRNTVQLLGNSDNYVNASVELANLDWENFKPEDIASAINYIRYSHVFQATMGDIEGQEQMNAFENTMSNLYKREYTLGEKHTGRIISAVDKNTNLYSILSGDLQDPNATFKVINEEGQISEMPASELTIIDLDTIENVMASEFHNRFSSESEAARLNSVRYNFESIASTTSKDVERVLTEYGIKKPSVGSKITLVTGEEATVIEDLENGIYKVNTYDSADGTFKDIEIPFYRIKSDNPVTAAAQEKAYKDTITAYEKGDFSEVQKINKSPEEKLDDIINSDYDSRLFDDKGAVKLDDQQIINNFSLEDPASLEDYINKLGNKVSPQVRQSLNNALKLSKIHNEINPQLSHLVQTSKNRTDVSILSNILSREIITSDPNITAEELLESIINNSNYNSKIRYDFKNILRALTNAKVQRRTTTKTKTSVLQKDVKGKKGRKQIEKGINDLRKALKDNNPIEALNSINRIDKNLSKVEDEPITPREKQFIEETRKTLKEQGYEIQPMRGMNYHEGMKVIAEFELNPELPVGAQIIKEVTKPQINKDGVIVQSAEIIVEQGPEIEEETPDISQAVTREMTEEEPMDFSETSSEDNINKTIDKARQGDAESIRLLDEYKIPIGEAGVYRFVSKEEVDDLLAGKTYQGRFKDGRVDVTSKKEGSTGFSSSYRVTFKSEFDLYKDDNRTRLKNEKLGDGYITGGYSLKDVATIERKNEDGSYTVVYQSNSNISQDSLTGKESSKKEDSIPQDTTEQEFTIPELERAFVIPDTDKLIETPSREEEVETLTDEQRREVTIQDSVNPNMREFKVDSILPDDITADEVIPDKHEVQGNRIYRYDGKQLREDRKQVRRIPNRPNDEHGSFYKWLEDSNTDLQGIIDNELSEIAALNPDVKFMMLTEGTKSGYPANSKILNVVFQVVEYTDAIEKIHKESRGGVITFEGTKYLVIGSTGFRSAPDGVFNPELNHYSFLADIVLKAARNKYTSNTNEVEREAYYVHPSMSTRIKDIQAGWIVTQTENDSSVQERSLGELFNDETRNPHGITIDSSKWLISTKNESKPITVRVNPDDVVHGLQIPTGLAGAVFLLVPAANGHYIPVSVKIGKLNELAEGKLKDAIWNTAQQLLDDNPDVRTQCIKDLCKILNLTKEGFNIFINNNDINLDDDTVNSDFVITSKGIPVYSVPLNTLDTGKLSELLFSTPFQLNIGLQTLTTPSELKMYIESGALKTEAAVLGTVNASYTVHSIDTNLKADPYTEQPTDSQEGSYNNSPLRRSQDNGVIYIGKNQYFRYAEDSYVDIKTGTPVTDAVTLKKIEKHLWLEKHKPTPAKVEKSGIKLYILGENEIMAVTKNGDISFITDKERVSGIIKAIQEETDNEVRSVNAKEELSRVEEQQQEEQIIPQKIQEEYEASTPEVNFTEDFDAFKDTESTPIEGSFEEVSFETKKEYTPKEKVSETFTEGVVENVGADQLLTTELLRDTKKQLIKDKIPKEKVSEIMDNIFNKLKEEGLESFYTSADESTIRSIIDIFTHCRNK